MKDLFIKMTMTTDLPMKMKDSHTKSVFSTKTIVGWHEKKSCKGGATNKNKQFFCTICNNSFSSKSNLKKHERKFCKSGSIKINSEDQKRVANKEGRFPCRKCNRTFKTKPIVKVHEKKSCKGKEAPANKKRRLAHENEIFQCIHCTQTFNSKCNLKRHEKKSCKKTRGSGVWSPLEPDCSSYPLVTEINCFYWQKNLTCFWFVSSTQN